jgi:hypothetical protein
MMASGISRVVRQHHPSCPAEARTTVTMMTNAMTEDVGISVFVTRTDAITAASPI